MNTTPCPFCKEAEDSILKTSFFIRDMGSGYLVLHPNQSYEGRCLFILKEHYENVWDIPSYVLSNFNNDLQAVASTLKDLFNADLVNFASLGNQVSHFHYHIFPRKEGDQNWGGPPWPNEERKLDRKEYSDLVKKIQKQLKIHYA